MTTPAPDSTTIAQVQSNLRRMQAFNDYVYGKGNCLIGNCYLLMTSTDSSDPGLKAGMALLDGAFGVVASFGAFGGFAGCFMCAEVESWLAYTPPDLNATFASMLTRFQHSSIAFDGQCAKYAADPVTYWNKPFSHNGTTMVLGDLATITFPVESDPVFIEMALAALKGLDIAIWQTVLGAQCFVTRWTYNSGPKIYKADTDMTAWDQQFIAKNPAWYNRWYWHADKGLFDKNRWYCDQFNLNFGATHLHTADIPAAACAYLFIDSADGIVINSAGLAARKAVFEQWPISKSVIDDTNQISGGI